MRLSHTVSQPQTSGEIQKPQSSGVRRPCVVFKIKPPTCETEIDETAEARPAIDLSQIDWVVHPDTNDILFFLTGDDWFIDARLLPPEFVRQAYIESGLEPARSCPSCS